MKQFFTILCSLLLMATSANAQLTGQFSVSASKQVYFSKGNLRYHCSSKAWSFATNQYDVIGAANASISSLYDGWIDLFGWGTGYNPTQTSIDYQKYGSFSDWGTNAISNGGNSTNNWRTLKKEEWNYLIFGRKNAESLFGLGSVNGVNGLILLPDDWTLPDGADFTPSTSIGMMDWEGYYRDGVKSHYSDNSYNKEMWDAMETAGAVFLPAAGYRHDLAEYNIGTVGYYWSASSNDPNSAYSINFYSYELRPQGISNRENGLSVRLVH